MDSQTNKRPRLKGEIRDIFESSEAAYQDCSALLTMFANKKSLSYNDFCECWRSMKFSYIFSGRTHLGEVREYTEEVLEIAKSFLVNPYNDITFKVGALYMMWGVYGKQSLRKYARFRMTESDFATFLSLVQELKVMGHIEACMVAFRLWNEDAFNLVLTPQQYGLHQAYLKYHDGSRVTAVRSNSHIQPAINDIVGPDLLEALEKLSTEYQVVKRLETANPNCELEGDENLVDDRLSVRMESKKEEYLQCLENGIHMENDVASASKSWLPESRFTHSPIDRKMLKEKALASTTARDKFNNRKMSVKFKPQSKLRWTLLDTPGGSTQVRPIVLKSKPVTATSSQLVASTVDGSDGRSIAESEVSSNLVLVKPELNFDADSIFLKSEYGASNHLEDSSSFISEDSESVNEIIMPTETIDIDNTTDDDGEVEIEDNKTICIKKHEV